MLAQAVEPLALVRLELRRYLAEVAAERLEPARRRPDEARLRLGQQARAGEAS